MSTVTYCDMDDCRNTNNVCKVYEVEEEFAKKCVKKGLLYSEYDNHFCEECVNNYFNEEDEQMKIDGKYFKQLVQGKDFKEKVDD